jgi:hypothetical protein
MSLKQSESSVVVLETPELQKTIEELNDEIEPKTFTQSNLGLETKVRDQSVPEILEKFNSDHLKNSIQSKVQFSYIPESKTSSSKSERLKELESELLSIGEKLGSMDPKDPDFSFCQEEFVAISEKLEKIQEKSQSVSKKHSFPKSTPSKVPNFSISNHVSFELSLSEVEDRNRLSRLENKIRELEFVVGTWKQSKPVCEALSEFIQKTKFLNTEFLDRLKDQARHLGTDLDIFLSSESQINSSDNSKEIGDLFKETFPALSNIPKLSLYFERVKHSYGLFVAQAELAKRLLNVEVNSENMLGSASHSLVAQENLKEGLEENLFAVRRSLEKLSK